MFIRPSTVGAAINVSIAIWSFYSVLRSQPTLHGLAVRIRWSMVALGSLVGAAGLLFWGDSLLGAELFVFGGVAAGVFLIQRDVSQQIATIWSRLKARSENRS